MFISYSHKDQKWSDLFQAVLMRYQRTLDVWSDCRLRPGGDWERQLNRALDEAKVALVLVSEDFLASDYVARHELPAILQSRRRGLFIHWVPVSSSSWKTSPLHALQASHNPERPLDTLSHSEQQKAVRAICANLVAHLRQASLTEPEEQKRLRAAAQERLPQVKLGELVSSGHSSLVFRSVEEPPPRAVKVLVENPLHEHGTEEMRQHAEAASELKHPVFIRIFQTILDKKPNCIVTEFVESKCPEGTHQPAPTLEDVLHAEGAPFHVDRVAVILRKLCEAIAEANEIGLMHGVLTSSDVLMQDRYTPRISAFGFWSYLSQANHLANDLVVNRELLSYMTPEHFYGLPPTPLTDQYSLGLLALEMLEGSRRLKIQCPADFLEKKAFFDDPFEVPRDWERRHPSFAALLKRMLQQRPEDRWSSLTEVTVRLARLEREAVVLAKNSYLECCASSSGFWPAFYRRLFEAQPELRSLFKGDMQVQYQTLDEAVQRLLNFPRAPVVEPTVLSGTATRHRSYHLAPAHFEAFKKALLETLREDCRQSEEVLRAWESTIAPGLDYMMSRSVAGRSPAADAPSAGASRASSPAWASLALH